jgi:uncharacterized protein (TIGR02246 family)
VNLNISQMKTGKPQPSDNLQISTLYNNLLDCWNHSNARGFADLFTNDGSIVGFDGTKANGRKEIYSHLNEVFTNHKAASYVSIIREIRFLSPHVALLRAVAGMIPPGKNEINPDVNAIQSMVAVKDNAEFRIALFQNTPAAFHQRPELREQLTKELQSQVRKVQ